ncbi:MAG: hydroxyisourate hydrolase [Streptosporangiaceae bacterium]|nr:hydroxyisourate hydrolase [Streptosporangiaceae bacterium]
MTLSTHVLDATTGRPAEGVPVVVERREADLWAQLGRGITGPDGRLDGRQGDWLPAGEPGPGVYRITFGSGGYFAERGVAAFYPEIAVCFEVSSPGEHYHVPLLLSPFAYSTYRGS